MGDEVRKDLKILIVDDMVTMRRILKKHLISLGFTNFNEAHDGEKALNLIKTGIELGVNFDLIISDWNMPGMTGLDLLKEVRSMENDIKDVPFLMITNETKQGNVVLAVQAGVNGYIGKPFSAHILYDKIKNLCSSD
jgi:two-component system, chemotaxis family, chemotaxis protein CheY